MSADDPRFQITFNFELLDDSYTIFKKSGEMDKSFFLNIESLVNLKDNQKSLEWYKMDLYDDANHLTPEAEPYSSSSTLIKLNHPLMIMVKEERVVGCFFPFFKNDTVRIEPRSLWYYLLSELIGPPFVHGSGKA